MHEDKPVVKVPRSLVPFRLRRWINDFYLENKRVPTEKEIDKANRELVQDSILRNSTYGITTHEAAAEDDAKTKAFIQANSLYGTVNISVDKSGGIKCWN